MMGIAQSIVEHPLDLETMRVPAAHPISSTPATIGTSEITSH